MLSGDNSVLQRGADTKEKSVDASVKEEISLAYNGAQTEGYAERWTTEQIANSMKDELKKSDSSANATATGTNIKVTYKGYEAVINASTGGYTKFERKTGGESGGLTVGEAYDQTLIQIGSKFKYTGNGETEWIVFGKDEDEDVVLLTTKEPVTRDPFSVNYGGARLWLEIEDLLHAHCSTTKYGDASRGITARSITLKDINRVTGFTEPEFEEYTFGTEMDYANKKVDYYYLSLDAAGYTTNTNANPPVYQYWKKATGASDSETFKNNWYSYDSSGSYRGADGSRTITLSNNTKYVLGGYTDGNEYYVNNHNYVVASRSVYVYSGNADFYVAGVGNGYVNSYFSYLCYSYSANTYDYGSSFSAYSVRPVVSLPSDILVAEGENGVYELAE